MNINALQAASINELSLSRIIYRQLYQASLLTTLSSVFQTQHYQAFLTNTKCYVQSVIHLIINLKFFFIKGKKTQY